MYQLRKSVIGTEGRNLFHYHHLLLLSLVPPGGI